MTGPGERAREGRDLATAFVEDHRVITRGFSAILAALDAGDVAEAARLADTLDREAGAHIEFEEEALYPEVARTRGEPCARRLLHEHAVALEALIGLREHGADESPDRARIDRCRDGIRTGLDHAVSCGTLVGLLDACAPERQVAMLDRLQELRAAGVRWSALPRST